MAARPLGSRTTRTDQRIDPARFDGSGHLGQDDQMSDETRALLDPRQVRTRHALSAALHDLLVSRKLDAISVAELCRAASVHRSTFYSYAPSVHAFAIDEFTRKLDQISDVVIASAETHADEIAERYFDSLRELLAHVTVERAGYRALFAASASGVFRMVLSERLRHRAQLALGVWSARSLPGAPHSRHAIDEASAFIAAGLVGVIEAWAFSDDPDAAAAAVRVATLMPGWWPAPPQMTVDDTARSATGPKNDLPR